MSAGRSCITVDNITHSLLGAALATLALPAGATPAQRQLFLAAGIASSNAPDLDLIYVGITPPPLGYLLHHRGHTHTAIGLLAQGALFALIGALLPVSRRLEGAERWRLALLIVAGLVSHVLLDLCNSYGVHPLYPLDARWYYGDALFIIEPWLWLLLAAALPWQAMSRRAGVTLVALLTLLASALIIVGVVHVVSVGAMAAAGVAIGWGARHLPRQRRALAALTASLLFVLGMFGLSRVARVEAREALATRARGDVVDIILSPNPASPLCWAVIGVERDTRAGEYALHRGTLSLLPSLRPPESCATHRLLNAPVAPGDGGTNGHGGRAPERGARTLWSDEIREPLATLRELSARDCHARAWLQFARAPFVRNSALEDLRFANGGRRNFTSLPLAGPRAEVACPPNVTSWGTPRADLLR